MTICKFFAQGYCRAGAKCRFEHVREAGVRGNVQSRNGSNPPVKPEHVTLDLKQDRPAWPLSTYGIGKEVPSCITGFDISQEEARLEYLTEIRSTGGISSYLARMNQLLNDMQRCVDTVVRNPISVINGNTVGPGSGATSTTPSPFGSSTGVTNSTGIFGKSSVESNSFGGSAFGQTKASAFAGSNTNSAFGGSAFGQQNTTQQQSPFGGSTNRFSVLASQPQQPQAPSAFGTASSFGTASAFGSTGSQSTFGSSNNASSVFGASSFGNSAASTNASSQQPTQPAFGTSSFGSGGFASALPNSNPTTTQPAFGSKQGISAFGQGNSSSVFGGSNSSIFQQQAKPTLFQQSSNEFKYGSQANLSSQDPPMEETIRNAFAAPQFERGQIPEMEPPPSFR